MTARITFTPMADHHLPAAVALSAGFGWAHGLADWQMVHRISNGVVALEGEQLVATALATPFGAVGMVNMVIVAPSHQRRGLGAEIMRRAMATISPPLWRLVATSDGLPLYHSLGFHAVKEIVQHRGIVRPGPAAPEAIWASSGDMAAIRALDQQATGMQRSALFDILERRAKFVILRDRATLTGFAALRPFGQGDVAGPIIARTPHDAERLLSRVMAERSGRLLRVDTSEGSGLAPGLGPWLEQRGLARVGGGIQMEMGDPVSLGHTEVSVYGLASQALG